MSVGYILKQCGDKMGLNPASPTDRPTLVRFLNEAARELYMQSDMPGSMWEQTFKVNGDQTITLPFYVGFPRGIRESASQQVWHFNQLRPRYYQFNWKDMWRNWRIRNRGALMATVTNQSVGVITVSAVENPPIVVTLTGSTANATTISETLTMDSVSKNSVNNFLDYVAVTKDRPNNYDVTLSDVDGKLLTVIPNTEVEAKYTIIDVSACPWLSQNTSPIDNYVELLYKKTLQYLSGDGDEFPAVDCDDIVVNKMMQLWKEEQDKGEAAMAYDAKATRTLARLTEENNRETEDMIALVANPHDTMLRRIGTGLRRRYNLYSGRRM